MAAARRRRRLNKLPGTDNHDDKTAEHSIRRTEPTATRSLWTPTSQRSLPLERAFRTSRLESAAGMCQNAGRDMLTGDNRASFTPWAARTQQYVKEQVGQVEDKVRVSQEMS